MRAANFTSPGVWITAPEQAQLLDAARLCPWSLVPAPVQSFPGNCWVSEDVPADGWSMDPTLDRQVQCESHVHRKGTYSKTMLSSFLPSLPQLAKGEWG